MTVGILFVIVLLLLLNGFFVAAEFAFPAANRHNLAARQTRSARAALAAAEDLSFTLAGAQLGITIASLVLGFVAEPAVAAVLEAAVGSLIEISDTVLHTISFIISLSIVVFLHMVIGEMAPKNIAIADPDRSALAMAIPFLVYSTLFKPIIWILNEFANLGLRAFGVDPDALDQAHTSDDLASIITAGRREGIVEEFAHRLLTGAIDLGGLEATHVMVPRPDVTALPLTTTLAEFERAFTEQGYSRIPVYQEDLDDIRGFVHAKDLLQLSPDDLDRAIPEEMLREVLIVPESARVDRLLEDMRRNRNHLAIVIDEYGGTAGIVTMEDIVEEVVGEIRDEHDTETDGVRKVSATRWIVDAALRPSEVRRASGLDLPEGEYDTVSGLVMERIGRIPRVGDRIEDETWTLRVRSMEGRRVSDVDLIAKRRRSNE